MIGRTKMGIATKVVGEVFQARGPSAAARQGRGHALRLCTMQARGPSAAARQTS